MLTTYFTRYNIVVTTGGKKQKMNIDIADKIMLDRYLTKKNELFKNEIDYCEKLIKKIIKEIIKNDLIKKI